MLAVYHPIHTCIQCECASNHNRDSTEYVDSLGRAAVSHSCTRTPMCCHPTSTRVCVPWITLLPWPSSPSDALWFGAVAYAYTVSFRILVSGVSVAVEPPLLGISVVWVSVAVQEGPPLLPPYLMLRQQSRMKTLALVPRFFILRDRDRGIVM